MARLKLLTLAAACAATVVTAVGDGTADDADAAPRRSRRGAGPGRGRGQAVTLPEGPGREIAQSMCASCHSLNVITGSAGYDRQGWHDVIATMMRLPEAQDKLVTEYLAANFPPKPERRPTLVPGDTEITIKEWIAPTLGQRVRDPLQLADQTIYWTGMFASLVGQLDPRTGEMREYKLPQGTTPHSILNDRDGYIWFTGQRQRHGRPSRSADRRHQGLSDAGSRGARSTHADLRSRRQPVVHAAELEHGRPPRAIHRRHQAAHRADRQRPSLRNHPSIRRECCGWPTTGPASSRASTRRPWS